MLRFIFVLLVKHFSYSKENSNLPEKVAAIFKSYLSDWTVGTEFLKTRLRHWFFALSIFLFSLSPFFFVSPCLTQSNHKTFFQIKNFYTIFVWEPQNPPLGRNNFFSCCSIIIIFFFQMTLLFSIRLNWQFLSGFLCLNSFAMCNVNTSN